jgi:hypothetical protein
MKVHTITSTNFGTGVRIKGADNKSRLYLYNEVNDITKEFKIPATFHTGEIELPSVTKDVIKKLNDLGIKFSNK